MRRTSTDQPTGPRDCLIGFWRGYVAGQFYAYEPGAREAIASSPAFRAWTPPWRADVSLPALPAARAAWSALTDELARRGWRAVGADRACREQGFFPAPPVALARSAPNFDEITDESVLGALYRVGRGATAADIGRALYGADASSVPHLPQRVASKLRRLQLHGKVERHADNGTGRWFPVRTERGTPTWSSSGRPAATRPSSG